MSEWVSECVCVCVCCVHLDTHQHKPDTRTGSFGRGSASICAQKQIRTKKVIMCYIKKQDELAEAARATTAKAAEEMLAQHFGSVPRKPYAAVHVCVCVCMYNHVAVRFVYACVCIQYIQVYSIYVEVRV